MKGRIALGVLLSLVAIQFLPVTTTICFSNPSYDVNGDGVVNIYDILVWADAFGTFEGEEGFNSAVDLDQNGVIDIFDAVLISLHFGEQI